MTDARTVTSTTAVVLGGRTFTPAYAFGDTVYHRARSDKVRGIVTDIKFCGDGGVLYAVCWGTVGSDNHYEMELTDTFVPDFSDV